MYKSNIASVKAYTRAGWVIEGVLKDNYIIENSFEDRILVACFNPQYFDTDQIVENSIKVEDVYKT